MNSWNPESDRRRIECVHVDQFEVRSGDRVRLKPQRNADIFDLVLSGKTAVIDTIEEDYEGRIYLAVTIDDDPGRDLGMLRQPGHRFFFFVDEVVPLGAEHGERS